jgi:phage baseplate assembly protein gpV
MSGWVGLSLAADDAPLDADLAARLVGLRLERHLNAPASLSLRFRVDAAEASTPLAMGVKLIVALESAVLFEGVIGRIVRRRGAEGAHVDVTAEDALAGLAAVRRLAAEEIGSVAGFARRMAAAAGLEFRAGPEDFAAGRHLNRFASDLEFLTRTLSRYGLAVVCRAGTLELIDLVRGRDAVPLAAEIITLTEAQAPGLADATTWRGWSTETDGGLRQGDIGAATGRGPVAVPARAAEPSDRLARAARHRAEQAATWFEAELAGHADLWPGDVVTVPEGGVYTLTSVELTLDAATGAVSRIGSRPLARSEADVAGASLITGTIESIADPDAAGRVRVGIAGYGGVRSGWLPVVGTVSREGGGFTCPFVVGDPVLIAAPEGDPELGLVLGGIWRSDGSAAALVSGEVRKGQAWRGRGMGMSMDEDEGRLRLALDGGAEIEMTDDRIRLKAAQLELECSGEIRIRGSRIDFLEA